MEPPNQLKVLALSQAWARHERWVNAGCTGTDYHELEVPGYAALAERPEAYALYRSSLVPFLQGFDGYPHVTSELQELVQEVRGVHAEQAKALMSHYEQRTEEFRSQWDNLFHLEHDIQLSHAALLAYQQKYEVELPLAFLCHLVLLQASGKFDPELPTLRDRRGGLQKGKAIQQLAARLPSGTPLGEVVRSAYNSQLRNAIAHNAYTLTEGGLKGVGTTLTVDQAAFRRHVVALQTLHNSIVWLFAAGLQAVGGLEGAGVLGIGWGASDNGEPMVGVLQLEPFFALDPAAAWLSHMAAKVCGRTVHTQLGVSASIEGPLVPELKTLFARCGEAAPVAISCIVIPIMPCVHDHVPDLTIDGVGAFCRMAEPLERRVPFSVTHDKGRGAAELGC
jgi:hypothetical protein